jgi:RNA polymerase sigma-70 factor (ECF subfamily)
VELSRQGDRVAFGELAITLGDRLHAVAHRILRDRDLAGDVTQQALVKIWQELPRLRDADLFDGWSYRVLVNTCRDEMRRRRGPSGDVDLLENDAWLPDASIPVADRDQLDPHEPFWTASSGRHSHCHCAVGGDWAHAAIG